MSFARLRSSAVLVLTILLATCPSAEAQQPKKIPRIGYLSGAGDPSNPGPNVEAFRRGLQELGYIDGKNDLDETKETMKMNTRHYVKRQLTWFRKDQRLTWIVIRPGDSAKDVAQKIIKDIS